MRHLAVLLVLVAGTAHAQPTCETLDEVSEGQKTTARRLQSEGNEELIAGKPAAAIAKYRAALAQWPHPKFHAAVGFALMREERWVEAVAALEQALACEARLDDDLEKTRGYLATASARTGTIAIEGLPTGVTILVDGKPAGVTPARAIRVLPGERVVVARRGDATSDPVVVEVVAGRHATATPMFYVSDSRWRWSRWKPWAVVGAGGAIALAGVPLLLSSKDLVKTHDRFVAESCPASGCAAGTPEGEMLAEWRDRIDRRALYANIAFVAGGTVAATGLVLVAFNRQLQTRRREQLAISPWLGGRGVTVTGAF